MRLTDALITNERYRGEPFTTEDGREQWPVCVLWDDEVEGFGVRIYPSVRGRPSRKDYIVSWRSGLRARTMAIGTVGKDCSLRQARKIARDALDLARRGQDPIEERQRALGVGTTEDLASRFLYEHTAARIRTGQGDGAEGEGTDESGEEQGVDAAPAAGEAAPAIAAEVPAPDVSDRGLATEVAEREEAAAEAAPAATRAGAPPLRRGAAPGAGAPSLAELVAPVASRVTASAPGPGAAGDRASAEGDAADAADPPAARSRGSLAAEVLRKVGGVPGAAPPRGGTKMRMLSLPDALYREIQGRAGAAELTISAYLQQLVDRDGAEASEDPAATQRASAAEEKLARIREILEDSDATAPEVREPETGRG